MRKTVIRQLTSKINILEQERRNHFVIIEGLPEDRNDNLRRKLDELFMAPELPYDSEWIDLAYRAPTSCQDFLPIPQMQK